MKRRTGYHEVIAESKKMQEVLRFVRKVAASEASTILIQGESGTGKDLIAKAIHYESSRQEKPFVAVNCSAIPETLMEAELFGHERGAFTDAKAMKKGLFEVTDGGTLFLDEIGELSPLLQAKLLRVLEDQIIRRVGGVRDMQVDVRVIAASNRDLERAVLEGTFRQDLFYRLAIISIFLPPLRERREDILPDGRLLHRALCQQVPQERSRHHRRNPQAADDPQLARQRPRTKERDRARHDPGRRRVPAPHVHAIRRRPAARGTNGLRARLRPVRDGQLLPNGRILPPLTIPEGGTSWKK